MRCSYARWLLPLALAGCWGPPAEGRLRCGTEGACPSGWVCRADGRCWSTPGDDAGLDAEGLDAPERDAPGLDAPDAGVMCEPGTREVLAPRMAPTADVPQLDGTPYLSLVELTAAGELVVTAQLAGVDRRPAFTRFDLGDWEGAPMALPGPEAPGETGYRSLALGHGAEGEALGFGLRTVSAGGEVVGFALRLDEGASEFRPLRASDVPNESLGGAAVLGGYHPVERRTEDTWHIGRERAADPAADAGRLVLGAADGALSRATYRSTRTTLSVENAVLAGSSAGVVLVQDPATFAIELWAPGASRPLSDLANRPSDTFSPGAPLSVSIPLGLADLAPAVGSPGNVIFAVPMAGTAGEASVEFRRTEGCPTACGETALPPTMALSAAPAQVRLEQTSDGYALVRLFSTVPDPSAVEVDFLRVTTAEPPAIEVVGAPLPLFEDVAVPGRIVAIASDVAIVGDVETLLVAALYRDAAAGTDQIVLTGVRRCAAR
jgi:hypothetical protein